MDFRFGGPPVMQPVPPPPPPPHFQTNQLGPVAPPVFNGQYHHPPHPPPQSPIYLQPQQPPHYFQGGAPTAPNYHFGGAPLQFQGVPQPQRLLMIPQPLHPPPPTSILATQTTAQVLSQIVQLSKYKHLSGPHFKAPDPRYLHKNLVYIQSMDNVFHYLLYPEEHNKNIEKMFEEFRTFPILKQLKYFFNWLQLSNEQIRMRWQIAFDMEYFLQQFYPRCQVFVFGSLLTDLGNLHSDVDMYADLCGDDGNFLRRNLYTETNAALFLRDKVHTELVRNNRDPHYYNKMFVKDVEAMGTRVPFLRFEHGQSGIMCDLTFASRISVQNSKLLNFYLSYDGRLGPLLIFLRYWARFHGIGGELKIKKYALALMALVFLMKEKKSVPSVEVLQELGRRKREAGGMKGVNPDFIEGWDASYCEDIGYVRRMMEGGEVRGVEVGEGYPYCDPQGFLELVLDFFGMWAGVELGSVVICALSGEVKGREDFLVGREMRTERMRRVVGRNFGGDKKLGIQDPFVVTFNVGGIAGEGTVDKLKRMCEVTWRKLEGERGRVKSILDFFVGEEEEGGRNGEGCNGN